VSTAQTTRLEHDLLGDREVPADAYYGVHTLRALENFPISGSPISTHPDLVVALACVKQAAARANAELGLLTPEVAEAIRAACEEVRSGELHEQFVVDVIQGGAGTSTNMNANEVIANRAIEVLGGAKGDYARVHPLDHVNRSQSTNDVYPTAVKVAMHFAIERLHTAMKSLAAAFAAKSEEFSGVLKMGRTQLQDAVPMTLGQEFATYAVMVTEDADRLAEAAALIREINLGGTAIGTGLNAPRRYAELAVAHLAEISGVRVVLALDLVEATQDVGSFVQLSGVLKRTAVKLSKICNDLRLLSSGPRTGINEINLPPRQPGSSIMPGKVNPVIPEAVNQVAFEIIGNDLALTLAAEGGQLQLNVMEPLIAYKIFDSIRLLQRAMDMLREHCITGITANVEHCRALAESSPSIVTPLNKYIGYEEAAVVAKQSLKEQKTIRQVVVERGYVEAGKLTEQQLDAALDVLSMTHP